MVVKGSVDFYPMFTRGFSLLDVVFVRIFHPNLQRPS